MNQTYQSNEKRMSQTDWSNLFKIKLSNIVEESMDKHDIIKLLLVRKLLRKNKKRNWIRIYTEFKLNGCVPDVYFENIKTKEIVCYEIQKNFYKKWFEEKTKQYKNYESVNFTLDFIPINLKDCPDDIGKINKFLDKFVC